MCSPPADQFVDLLAERPAAEGFFRQFGVRLDDADHVPDGGIGVESQGQIGPLQDEQGKGVGMNKMTHVEHFAEEFGRGRRFHPGGVVQRMRSGEMMGRRTNTADAGRDERHPVGFHADQDSLESPEFVDDKSRRCRVTRPHQDSERRGHVLRYG